VRRAAVWSIAALLAVGVAGCAHPRTAPVPRAQTCRDVVPDPEPLLVWITPQDARHSNRLADWCETVGPILYHSRPYSDIAAVDSLVIVTWNVHVGGGDIDELIRRLERGDYTGGEPVEHFVLLLQEVYRRQGGVPVRLRRGLPVPARIGSRARDERGADVERVARERHLSLMYAPSMRNGDDGGEPEDRGNAIVSTLELHSPTVVELTLEHQRRVAAAVVLEGRMRSGTAWRLRVADAHFDTALALTRGGPLAARRRQAAVLVDALAASPEDTVVGGDFNTWLGSREPALKTLHLAFPDAPVVTDATWKGPFGLHASLDHLLFRGRAGLQHVKRLPDRLGSDHYPVLGIIRF